MFLVVFQGGRVCLLAMALLTQWPLFLADEACTGHEEGQWFCDHNHARAVCWYGGSVSQYPCPAGYHCKEGSKGIVWCEYGQPPTEANKPLTIRTTPVHTTRTPLHTTTTPLCTTATPLRTTTTTMRTTTTPVGTTTTPTTTTHVQAKGAGCSARPVGSWFCDHNYARAVCGYGGSVSTYDCPAGYHCKEGSGTVWCARGPPPASTNQPPSSRTTPAAPPSTTTAAPAVTTSTQSRVGTQSPRLPARSGIPGGLSKQQVPQLVYFSFDDGINTLNSQIYRKLFVNTRRNPNGCPIRATFFNSGKYTDYNEVSALYRAGHELASHSRSHQEPTTWWNKASLAQWTEEIEGQRQDIAQKAAIPKQLISGMRAPFLALGSDTQYRMLEQSGFAYDSSISNIGTPMWPFTMDAASVAKICTQGANCPKQDHLRLWQVPLFTNAYNGHRMCAMVDGCRPNSEQETFDFLATNFALHRDSPDKPPFGVNMHAAWFATEFRVVAMERFIDQLLKLDDVYIVPIVKVLQWVENPTPLNQLANFQPFSCPNSQG